MLRMQSGIRNANLLQNGCSASFQSVNGFNWMSGLAKAQVTLTRQPQAAWPEKTGGFSSITGGRSVTLASHRVDRLWRRRQITGCMAEMRGTHGFLVNILVTRNLACLSGAH